MTDAAGRRHCTPLWLALAALLVAVPLTPAAGHSRHEEDAGKLPAPGYQPLPFTAPEPGSYQLPVLGEAADARLLDSNGAPQSLHELFRDRVVVLSFIYTSCSDSNGCPLASYVLGQVQQRLARDPELGDAVRLVSISFDPAHDTPAVLHDYRKAFVKPDSDWVFLTAESESRLAPLLQAYGQSLKQEVDADGNFTGNWSHILRVYLIDRAANIRNIYTVSFLHADTLVSDIRTILLSEAAAAKPAGIPEPAVQSPGDDRRGYTATDDQTRSKSLTSRRGKRTDLLKFVTTPPTGLPAVPEPADNPVTPARVALGRKLFYDRRLSHNNTISCAMCHVPEQGFTVNEMATAVGIEGRSVRRNAPTLYNVAYARRLFHDARETSLEQQIWGPLLAANEMGNPSVGYLLERIRALPDYRGLFETAFDGKGPGMETLGKALAAYQRTLVSANSPFDRWYYGGQQDALPDAAVRGFNLFSGEAGCSRCHSLNATHALFTDQALHNTGIGYRASFRDPVPASLPVAPGESLKPAITLPVTTSDLGRYEISGDPGDRWKYRTPTLRNVALTAPYMHDGSLGSLQEVVAFYNAGGVVNPNLDPLLKPLELTPSAQDDLVAFLLSLTGDNVDVIVEDAFAAPVGDP
ncbi:MAG: cytochrome c peroxidase [Gammaproteobacteria bacterium]